MHGNSILFTYNRSTNGTAYVSTSIYNESTNICHDLIVKQVNEDFNRSSNECMVTSPIDQRIPAHIFKTTCRTSSIEDGVLTLTPSTTTTTRRFVQNTLIREVAINIRHRIKTSISKLKKNPISKILTYIVSTALVRIHRIQVRLVHVLQLVDAVHQEVPFAHVGRHVLRAFAVAGHLFGKHRVQVWHLQIQTKQTKSASAGMLRRKRCVYVSKGGKTGRKCDLDERMRREVRVTWAKRKQRTPPQWVSVNVLNHNSPADSCLLN